MQCNHNDDNDMNIIIIIIISSSSIVGCTVVILVYEPIVLCLVYQQLRGPPLEILRAGSISTMTDGIGTPDSNP